MMDRIMTSIFKVIRKKSASPAQTYLRNCTNLCIPIREFDPR